MYAKCPIGIYRSEASVVDVESTNRSKLGFTLRRSGRSCHALENNNNNNNISSMHKSVCGPCAIRIIIKEENSERGRGNKRSTEFTMHVNSYILLSTSSALYTDPGFLRYVAVVDGWYPYTVGIWSPMSSRCGSNVVGDHSQVNHGVLDYEAQSIE